MTQIQSRVEPSATLANTYHEIISQILQNNTSTQQREGTLGTKLLHGPNFEKHCNTLGKTEEMPDNNETGTRNT